MERAGVTSGGEEGGVAVFTYDTEYASLHFAPCV